MPRPRKQLDFRAAAEALTAPGAETATMAAIARRLEVAKPTLYRMAGSREELVQLCVDAEAERLLEQLHRAAGITGFLGFVEDSPAGFKLLFDGRHPQARQAVRRVENRLGDDLRRQGVPHAQTLAAGLIALAAGVTRRALEDGVPLESLDLQAILERSSPAGN